MKLNKMTNPHAGILPNMEEMIENMAKQRFKSKLDLRSGFWQVGLTDRAKDLTAFTIPNGRCFRWNCMPFGLQGAPGIFQEMMELLIQKVKMQPNMRDLLSHHFWEHFLMIVALELTPLKIILEFLNFGVTKPIRCSSSNSLRMISFMFHVMSNVARS